MIAEILGDYVFGFDDDTLESVIAHLLLQKHLTVAVAESCTGGLIASRLTDVAGSSNYFKLESLPIAMPRKLIYLELNRKLSKNTAR